MNEAVERAHRQGILTAASLMVTGAAAADAVQRARRLPSLRIGLHLVLVDGVPALSPRAVPDLIDGAGRFRSNMALAGLKFAISRETRRQLAAETAAQYRAFAATGLPLDHLNGHRHFHVHPVIARLAIQVGREFGNSAVRAPLEPAQVLRQIEPNSEIHSEWPLTLCAQNLLKRARGAGLFVPDQVFGVRWSGAMTQCRLRRLIGALPSGTSEIYLHPAMCGGFAGSAPGYRYVEEFAALVDSDVIAAARAADITLGGFTDFLSASTPSL